MLPTQIRKSINKQARHVLEAGQRFKRFDQLRQRHFWSCSYFTPDANGYISAGVRPVFTIPPGQTGQGFPLALTERETNWKSQNRVPDNQNFEITEIGVSILPITADMAALSVPTIATAGQSVNTFVRSAVQNEFLNNTVIDITYLTNSVPLGLAADFAQASAPHVGTYRENETSGYFRSNGFPAPALRRKFKIPILLQHGETFSFAFNVPRAFFVGRLTFTDTAEPPVTTLATPPFIARLDFWATESFVEKS